MSAFESTSAVLGRVRERQEQPAAVLGVDRDDAQVHAGLSVDDGAAEVDRVVTELPSIKACEPFTRTFAIPSRLTRFAQAGLTHLDGRGAGLGLDAAPMRDAHDQVQVPHRLAEQPGGDVDQGRRLPFPSAPEADGFQGQALDHGRREGPSRNSGRPSGRLMKVHRTPSSGWLIQPRAR